MLRKTKRSRLFRRRAGTQVGGERGRSLFSRQRAQFSRSRAAAHRKISINLRLFAMHFVRENGLSTGRGKKVFSDVPGKLTFRCNRSARARVKHNPDLLRNKSRARHAEFISPWTRIGLRIRYRLNIERAHCEDSRARSVLISYLVNLLTVEFRLEDLPFRTQ